MALPRGLGMVMADTWEVMDKKGRKELNIKIMKKEFAAVKTRKNYFDGPINTNVSQCEI